MSWLQPSRLLRGNDDRVPGQRAGGDPASAHQHSQDADLALAYRLAEEERAGAQRPQHDTEIAAAVADSQQMARRAEEAERSRQQAYLAAVVQAMEESLLTADYDAVLRDIKLWTIDLSAASDEVAAALAAARRRRQQVTARLQGVDPADAGKAARLGWLSEQLPMAEARLESLAGRLAPVAVAVEELRELRAQVAAKALPVAQAETRRDAIIAAMFRDMAAAGLGGALGTGQRPGSGGAGAPAAAPADLRELVAALVEVAVRIPPAPADGAAPSPPSLSGTESADLDWEAQAQRVVEREERHRRREERRHRKKEEEEERQQQERAEAERQRQASLAAAAAAELEQQHREQEEWQREAEEQARRLAEEQRDRQRRHAEIEAAAKAQRARHEQQRQEEKRQRAAEEVARKQQQEQQQEEEARLQRERERKQRRERGQEAASRRDSKRQQEPDAPIADGERQRLVELQRLAEDTALCGSAVAARPGGSDAAHPKKREKPKRPSPDKPPSTPAVASSARCAPSSAHLAGTEPSTPPRAASAATLDAQPPSRSPTTPASSSTGPRTGGSGGAISFKEFSLSVPREYRKSSGKKPSPGDSLRRMPALFSLHHELLKDGANVVAQAVGWHASTKRVERGTGHGAAAAVSGAPPPPPPAAALTAFAPHSMHEVADFVSAHGGLPLAGLNGGAEFAATAAAGSQTYGTDRWGTMCEAAALHQRLGAMAEALSDWRVDAATGPVAEAHRLADFMGEVAREAGRVSQASDPLRARMARHGVPWDEDMLPALRWGAQAAAAALVRFALDCCVEAEKTKGSWQRQAVLQPLGHAVLGVFPVHQFAGGFSTATAALVERLVERTVHYARLIDPKWLRSTRLVSA